MSQQQQQQQYRRPQSNEVLPRPTLTLLPVPASKVVTGDFVTIGEALEAAAITAGNKLPVRPRDAATIQAAEVRATGLNVTIPGGVAAAAQAAAAFNSLIVRNNDK